MIDKSLYGANQWKWTFTPGSVQYMIGSSTSQFPYVRFTQATCYTAKLVVKNAYGSDSVTQTCVINVTAYPTPDCGQDLSALGNQSMGISKVKLVQSGFIISIDGQSPFLPMIDTTFVNPQSPCYEFVHGNQSG